MIRELYKKDVLRLIKQPAGFLFLVALPLILAALMGMIFNNNQDSGVMPSIKLIIEDHDDSFVSGMLKGAFGQGDLSKMFDMQEVEKDAGRTLIEEDKAAALLIFPKGFSDSLFAISNTELVLVKNPSLVFGPKITEEVVQIFAEGADRLMRVGQEPLELLREQLQNDRMSDEATAAIAVLFNQLLNKTGSLIFDPPISMKKSQEAGDTSSMSDSKKMFALSLTGIATMSLFFLLNGLAVDYFREREFFTLYRILVSPTSVWHYVLSKQLYLLSAGLIGLVAVWLTAFTLLGIPIRLGQLLPFFVILFLIASSGAGIISLLYTLVRTRGQASALLPAVIILFALLGGGMIPIQSLPAFFKPLSVFSPIFWGVDALQKVLIDNGGFAMILSHIIILIALTSVTMATALLLQKRRIQI